MRTWKDFEALRSTPLEAEILEDQTAVIIVTDHSNIDYDLVLQHAPLIIDARGAYRHETGNNKIISA